MNLIRIKKFYQSFIRFLIIYLFFHLSKRNTFFTMKLSFRFLTLIFLNHVEKIDSKIYSNHGTENEVKNSYPQIPRRILSPHSLSLCFSVSKKKIYSAPLFTMQQCNIRSRWSGYFFSPPFAWHNVELAEHHRSRC